MIVNPYTGVVNSSLSGAKTAASRVEKAIGQIVSGERFTKASDDISSISTAVALQNKTAGLRAAISNFSEARSLSAVAADGIEQIQSLLDRARQIATQAGSGIVDAAGREGLNVEFKSIIARINQISGSTSFNGKNLLDGSLELSFTGLLGESGGEDVNSLSIAALDSQNLFGGQDIDVSTQEKSAAALEAVQQALNSVGTARASVGSFDEVIDVASASIESALFNQDAALSLLSDADFSQASIDLSQAILQQNAATAVNAQAKRLPPSMLELIS